MSASPPAKATRREWVGLAVLSLPCILASMDMTVLNLALPALSVDLKPTASQLLWIMDIYGFLIAGSLITMGTLGDRIGRRKLLMVGAVAFGAASVLAAFSRSPRTLIFTRALLGVAGATLAPSTLSLIRNMFHDHQERTTAIAVWATCFSVGAAAGPVLGGLVLAHFPWGAVFLLNVPVMVLLIALGPALLPEFKDPNAGRLDLGSAGLSLSAVLLLIYSLKSTAEHGASGRALAAMAAGAVLAAVFIRRQRHLKDPFIDLRLFRSPAFSVALAMNLLGCVVAFGAFLFLAQHMQLVLGLSPLEAGLWSIPSTLGFTVGSMATPRLARRASPGRVIAGGLIVSAAGFASLAFTGGGTLASLVAGTFVYSVGLAPIFTLSTDLIVGSAPPERAGSAASLSETCSEFGGALGLAVLGSLGMAVYRARVAPGLPRGLPEEAARGVRGSLGGAVDAARQIPDQAPAILEAARAAFGDAVRLVTAVDAAIVIGMAVLAAVVLGRTAPTGSE